MIELRAGDHRIVGNIAHPAQAPHDFQHPLTGRAKTALQHIADHQRPGVNKRVTRFALLNFQLQQRIKRLAGGIFTHPLPDLLFLIVVHRHHQTEDFGDRLNRETLVGVTGAVVLTVHRTDCHAELIAADPGQGRNIVRHFTAANQRPDFSQNGIEHCVINYRRHARLLANIKIRAVIIGAPVAKKQPLCYSCIARVKGRSSAGPVRATKPANRTNR
ncbi:Uncharacterised protein [Klebsiella oxytoca]|nr:Uncharacterised protein [Klebsiella oxytoca]